MIRWGASHWLLLLWALIPVAWIVFFALRRRERRLHRFFDPAVIPVLAPFRKRGRQRTRNIYWLLGLALCLTAFARPQWGFHWQEVKQRGLDIMVVLDTSKSMMAEDIKPNRLQQAKWGIRDLVQKLNGDRIGLVSFAGSSFLQCPLTVDYAAFLMTLDDIYAGIIPRGGTAIENALREAMDSFEYDTDADRAIILVTDGEDHEGDPTRLIEDLQKRNIRVYAVGVGSLEGDLIPMTDREGHMTFLKDQEGKVIKSALQEDALQKLALETDGVYVRSAPGDFGLERIYDRGIDKLQRDEQESRMVKEYEDRFMWFLGAAFILLAWECILGDRTRKAQYAPSIQEE
jgi:Ca-activated chloride channel family protein